MEPALVRAAPALLSVFAQATTLSVRQRKRWVEILTSFDARNSYAVHDQDGRQLLGVQEQGQGLGCFLKRLFLGPFRPFTAHVEAADGQRRILTLRRPFRFYFHRLEVSDGDGRLLGAIQRRWAWLRRRYVVEGDDGRELATLFGPILRPWTFKILLPGDPGLGVGLLQKRWSGMAKELFTQADNFWITFDGVQDPGLRALLFSATVLIDVVHFERKH